MARICFSQRGRGVLTEWSSFSGGVRSWSLFDDRLHKCLIPNPFIFLPFNAGPRICLSQQVCLPTNRGEIIELISGLSDEVCAQWDVLLPGSSSPKVFIHWLGFIVTSPRVSPTGGGGEGQRIPQKNGEDFSWIASDNVLSGQYRTGFLFCPT